MTWHRIKNVSVSGGFLDGAQFDLCDGLNCFIGARGTGKTTVLELVRYALNALPSRDDQNVERRRLQSLIERNLSGGRVDVAIETDHGLSYVVSRSDGEDSHISTNDGRPVDGDIGSGGFFRADIYSQNEVESIADRASSQLTLLDNFEPEIVAKVEARLQDTINSLATKASQMRPVKERIAELSDEVATLPCVQEKLDALMETQGEDAKAINQAHANKSLRDRETRLLMTANAMLLQVQRSAIELKGRIHREWSRLIDLELTNGANGLLIAEASDEVRRCGDSIDESFCMVNEALTASIQRLNGISSRLKEVHNHQESEFRELIEVHEKAQGQAAERARWERHRNELLQKDRERKQLTGEMEIAQRDRANLLATLSELRDERFAIRQQVADKINSHLSPTIRVSVIQFGDTAKYADLLESNLSSAKIRHILVAKKISTSLCPSDLADILTRRDKTALMERADLNIEQADKVVTALSEPEFILALETVELNDLPKIELLDGGTYKDSRSLSTGQKCTAILPILLLDSDNPLLVDQPEDNLDNRFIYQTVVESIRKIQKHRQLIFVTHNPNIPVLGNAGRVFVLESNGTRAHKSSEGTVDECRDPIVTLLEGGEEAFTARRKRYSY